MLRRADGLPIGAFARHESATMQTIWMEMPRDERAEALLTRELGIHALTARLLVNRGLVDPAAAELFLHPKLSDLHDPFGLPDMDKAARRIADAVTGGEKIFVYGDYDADGVTSTAVYVRALTKLGAKVIHRVPHRQNDGYDLQQRAIQYAHEQQADLIITTDCGIQAREAVEYANSLGLTVIITDHHEPGDSLPNAYAVVNPCRRDSTYAFTHLAGVGVAYKTMQAVTRLLKPEWESALIHNFLDLVAIGTVADVMPLLGENRIFAGFGLEALRRTKKIGLRALLDGADIDLSDRLSPEAVGYGIAPRINAVGRLDDAAHALDLLLTVDVAEAQSLVARLNEFNQERQLTQRRIQLQAIEKVVRERIGENPVMVVAAKGWNPGVIGIVAGKLAEQFHRPAIVIGVSEDGTWGKGSARSIPAFDIFKGIAQCHDLLESCGGHAHAAGLSLTMDKFDAFCGRLCSYAGEVLTPEDFVPTIAVDAVVDTSDINLHVLDEWDQFYPHGEANPAAQLISLGLRVSQIRRIGKDLSHLKFTVDDPRSTSGSGQTECIGWGLAPEWDGKINAGETIDLVYAPTINRFQGRRTLQLVIKDLAASGQATIRRRVE
jgi:single-stranded-DNA-specific exonuclease